MSIWWSPTSTYRGWTALSLLQKLQEAEDTKSTIIVSAYGDMSNIRTATNRGAFDFLTKPIDFGDLETTIDKTIRHVEAMREARRRQAEAERAWPSLLAVFLAPDRLTACCRRRRRRHGSALARRRRDFRRHRQRFHHSAGGKRGTRRSWRCSTNMLGGMTDVVFAHEGTVAKIIGDAIQILFNAPGDQPDYCDPRDCLRPCARQLGRGISPSAGNSKA